jgi:Predicted metal-dependent hydrolase with the TIM-barrel fold
MEKPINIKSILTYSTLSVLIISLFVSNKKIDFSKGDNLLFHNGPIITMERDRPSAESVYIENGIIRSIGDYENIRKTIKPSTRIIDLKGKTLLPGFIDSHTHPVISAFLYDMVDLSGFYS